MSTLDNMILYGSYDITLLRLKYRDSKRKLI